MRQAEGKPEPHRGFSTPGEEPKVEPTTLPDPTTRAGLCVAGTAPRLAGLAGKLPLPAAGGLCGGTGAPLVAGLLLLLLGVLPVLAAALIGLLGTGLLGLMLPVEGTALLDTGLLGVLGGGGLVLAAATTAGLTCAGEAGVALPVVLAGDVDAGGLPGPALAGLGGGLGLVGVLPELAVLLLLAAA